MTAPRPLNILLVFTGGTIASRDSGGVYEMIGAPYRLLSDAPAELYKISTCEPVQILSENMTPVMLFDLFRAISKECSLKLYDGIIVAHGTDTLAYSAQLAQLLLSGLGIPVVFIGSKLPLDSPISDGRANFINALALIRQVTHGVYVVSRAQNGTDYVHSAGKVMQASSQTDDFQSFMGQYAGIMVKNIYQPNPAYKPPLSFGSSRELLSRVAALAGLPEQETVLVLDACVGMNYKSLNLTRPEYDFIIHRLYHSGTSCTAPIASPYSLLYLQDLCKENFKRLFIAPIEKDRTPYSSTLELLNAGIKPVYDCPLESVWAELLICTWLGETPEELFDI